MAVVVCVRENHGCGGRGGGGRFSFQGENRRRSHNELAIRNSPLLPLPAIFTHALELLLLSRKRGPFQKGEGEPPLLLLFLRGGVVCGVFPLGANGCDSRTHNGSKCAPPPSAQGWLVHSWATEKKEPSLSSLPLSRVQTHLRRHRNGNNHASNFQMNRSFTPPSSSASAAPLSLGRRGEGEGPTDQEGTLPPSLRRYVRRGGEEGGGQLANFFGLAVGVRSLRGSQAMCGQTKLEEQQHFFSKGRIEGGGGFS